MSKLDVSNTIWAVDCARLLGICKNTFDTRYRLGRYRIRRIRTIKGYRYSMRDLFEMLHPNSNKKEIDNYIADYLKNKKG
jgi:hypothetical protein